MKGDNYMLVFDKEAIIKSIIEAGNEDKITQEVMDDLDNYDGCKAVKSNWDALVYDKELYIVKGRNGNICKIERRFVKEHNIS